ncbi:hypothetical protein D7V82_22335 [bacterium 1xD8-6]|nr:hypothetical protein D7V82_22335 [bacterium 1xD8-6]
MYILEKSYEEIVLAWKFPDFIFSITSPEFLIDQNKFTSFLFRTVSQYLVMCSLIAVSADVRFLDKIVVEQLLELAINRNL